MFRALFLLVVALFTLPALAGYAQLAPPPGITSVGNVTTIATNSAAANGARYVGGHVVANASLNVGARAVTVPVAYRVAANAGVFAATKLNPWVAGASLVVTAIPLVVDWFTRGKQSGVISPDLYVDPVTGQLSRKPRHGFPDSHGDVDVGNYDIDATQSLYHGSVRGSANWAMANFSGECGRSPYIKFQPGSACSGGGAGVNVVWCVAGGSTGTYNICTSGGVVTGTGTGAPPSPVTTSDISPLGSVPFNPALLPLIGEPIPIEGDPVINPAPQPVGTPLVGPVTNPAVEAQPSPIRFPDGDPVPIPNTSPQRYTQPWHEVVPSPIPGNPWRVDIRPVTTETTDPTPVPDPVPNPNLNPNLNPDPNPNPTADFYTDCDKYPASLGCTPVGTPPPDATIPTRTLDITQQTGPTFAGGGCPANLNFNINGQQITGINMATPCGWITSYVKPVILLLAAISAVFIVLPKSE